MRTFIAISLPSQVKGCLAGLEHKLMAWPLKIRWVKPANIHLTLKFLGEIETDRVDAVAVAMALTARTFSPIQLSVQGLGVFPGFRNPRVLWTGVGGQTDLLAQLQGRLDSALVEKGFEAEKRPFKAHLTLGRFKGRAPSVDLLEAVQQTGCFEAVPFEAADIILFKSDLRPQGAVYTPLQHCPLGNHRSEGFI